MQTLPDSWRQVTPLSKFLAAFFFITFPFLGFYLGLRYQQLSSPVAPPPLKVAAVDPQVPRYTLAAQLSADLKGNGQSDSIRFYRQDQNIPNCPFMPIIIRVFSPTGLDEYTYTFGSDNDFATASAIPSLWSENRDVLLVESISTGCGSGSGHHLTFIRTGNTGSTYNQGYFYYSTLGPDYNELDSYELDSAKGEILVAEAIWADAEGHFAPHRYHLVRYSWSASAKKFVRTELGSTKNKYGGIDNGTSFTINDLVTSEPSVLNQ